MGACEVNKARQFYLNMIDICQNKGEDHHEIIYV